MLCFSTFSKKIYCNKDCNWEGEPSGTPFKLWEKSYGKLNQISSWREKKTTWHPCYNNQPWLTSWNICCCRVVLVWQTIDDRVRYWQWTLKNYISNGHIHIYPLVILVKYSASDYYSWSQILSLPFVPEGRCCCSVTDVEYYCWVAEVIYCFYVPEVRDSCSVSEVRDCC